MYNTPPTYSIYIAGLVFEWLKAQAAWRRLSSKTSPKPICFMALLMARACTKTVCKRLPLAHECAFLPA